MTTPAPFAPGRLRRAAAESLGGLPQQFWWLWVSTLVNRLGGFVVTFLALYLTVQRRDTPPPTPAWSPRSTASAR